MELTGLLATMYTMRFKLKHANPYRQPLKKSPLQKYRNVEQISNSDVPLKAPYPSAETGQKPTDTDWAYLAAYIDGEGSVTISQGGSCQLEIASVNPHVLDWIGATFGGTVGRVNTKARRSLFRWRIYGSDLRVLIPNLLTYSKVKGDQLAGVIEYYDYPPHSERRNQIVRTMKIKKRYDYAKATSRP